MSDQRQIPETLVRTRRPGARVGNVPGTSRDPGRPGSNSTGTVEGGERPAANDPLPEAANDPLLEEVKVTGKNWAKYTTWLRTFGRGWPGFGSIPSQEFIDKLYQDAVNELTEQDAQTQSEIEEAIQNDDPLEEVFVSAKKLPVQAADVAADIYQGLQGDPWASAPPMEEITVRAKNLKHGAAQTIQIGWSDLELFFNHYWQPGRPRRIDPGYRPPNELPEPLPELAPRQPPKVNPDTNPDDTPLGDLSGNPYISVGIALTLSPGTGIQIRTVKKLEPAARREENKVRRDRKEQHASRRYRALLRVFNMTFGTATEVLDFWNILADNITINGIPLSQIRDPLAALKRAAENGQWDIDMDQALMDLLFNQVQDNMIGRSSRLGREALNQMGYYGPNPGSYDSHLGKDP